jgi:uncharacterized protein
MAFHAGEIAFQERTGRREALAAVGPRVIRDHLIDQHREFFAQLPFVLLGTVDSAGQPRASLLTGPVGFAHSPDPLRLRVDALPSDSTALALGQPIALLGIELPSKRRNRLNGDVESVDARGFTLRARQSFGNCPKYIHAREVEAVVPTAPARIETAGALSAEDQAIVRRSDTFFIASANLRADAGAARGVDVSHRGGPAGFVHVDDPRTLTIPDYVGNFFFNTLGNLALEPRCGLLFPDLASSALLQLAARAEILWSGEKRALRFHLTEVRRLAGGSALRIPDRDRALGQGDEAVLVRDLDAHDGE